MLKKIIYPALSLAILFYSLLPGTPLPEVVLCIGSDGNITFFRPNQNVNLSYEVPPSESGTAQFAHDDCLDISVHTPGPRIAPVSKRYTELETSWSSMYFTESPAIFNFKITFQNQQKTPHSHNVATTAANPVLLI
ncbi:MAG: hypothetical protein GXO91_09305 [FCB group bacterium]|nr:hypothetical protein [FCB group bacterium]